MRGEIYSWLQIRPVANNFELIVGLEELYPNGGFLGTGFRMWGINGTARVLSEYTKAVRNRALILKRWILKEISTDACMRRRGIAAGFTIPNPFRNASAYYR